MVKEIEAEIKKKEIIKIMLKINIQDIIIHIIKIDYLYINFYIIF